MAKVGRKRESRRGQIRTHVWLFRADWLKLKKLFNSKKFNTPSAFIRYVIQRELRSGATEVPRAP